MNEVFLVGNNMAMLVAAAELARRGRAVRLFTDGKPLGAHFAGMKVQGLDFDVGMVLLERVRPATPRDDLRTYRSGIRNDWTSFGHLAWQWLEQQGPLRRVPTPECRIGGRTGPDYLMTNRLDLLPGLRLPGPDALPPDDAQHPRRKAESGPYDTLSYAQVAQRCHGEPFHATAIEPFVRKLMGVGSDGFLARYHRAAWAPLFYPETLREALAGRPTALAEYPFWTPPGGFVGQVAADVLGTLQANPRVSVNPEALLGLQLGGSTLTVRTAGGEWTCNVAGCDVGDTPAALGLASDRCHALLGLAPPGAQPAASVVVAFCEVDARHVGRPTGCLMVVDEDHASYRLSDQDTLAGRDAERHRVTIEASPERLAALHPGLTADAALVAELCSLLCIDEPGAVRLLKCITARNAIHLPTATAVHAAAESQQRLAEALPGVPLTGNLLGYGVASFNDQIVQGLKLAEELS